ncbi:MAG: DUF4105 domain-containing protein [Treponema sp.]|jgi:hypothetical protein|nr:DUF4105 domain-containing protein [Treponema sp.]
MKRFLLCLPFLALLGSLSAGEGDPFLAAGDAAGRGDYLTLKLAVLGPGDELYLWWGHMGLIIEDALSGQDRFYDWGVFSFDRENFFYNFAFGRLVYSCAAGPAEANISRIIRENRDITLYTLDLPPEVKTGVMLFAENNVLPENRDYFYHHFKDNCATRIRDIIDTATGGAFRARYGEAPGRFTLREHVRRHTWFSPPWDWALNFWMGQDIDKPITVWDEMFLPSEIAGRIKDFTYTGSRGEERKLVSRVETLNRAVNRPGVLSAPPAGWGGELAAGLGIAAFFLLCRVMESRKQKTPGKAKGKNARSPWRVLLGTGQAALGLFFGALGFILFFMSLFTNHDYTYHNSSLLFVNPLLFIAAPQGLLYAFTGNEEKRRRSARLLKLLWTYVFCGGLLTMAIKFLPLFCQQNQPVQALILPFALALSFAPDLAGKGLRRKGLCGLCGFTL